jgi:purine nucleoside phosphorylase
MNEKVLEAVTLLKRHIRNQPQIGIILGSGLGGLVDQSASGLKTYPISRCHQSMVIEAKYYAAPSAAQAFSHFPEEYTTMRVTACSRSCFRSG